MANKQKIPEKWRKIAIGAVLAIALIALVAAALYSSRESAPSAAAGAEEIGTFDRAAVMRAHPDYEKLKKLEAEKQDLLLTLREAEDFSLKPPLTDPEPFQDAVWQKNAQQVIEGRVMLERERTALREQYQKEHGDELQARSDAIDAMYKNEILNLNLKLENQEAMHHPWDPKEELEAERERWLAELASLKEERLQQQIAMRRAYEEEMAAHIEEVLAPKIAEWQANSKATLDQEQSGALLDQSMADARNARQMELASTLLKVQDQKQKQERLWETEQEIETLTKKMDNDIRGRTAKLAILHHLTLVVATPLKKTLDNLSFLGDEEGDDTAPGSVINLSATDLTEELINEMKSLPRQDEQQDNKET